MNILKMYATSPNERYIQMLVDTLKDGGIIVYPTDTLYAIGCDALNNRAIERICAIKGINPEKTNLSIVCSDMSQASEYAKVDNRAFPIMKRNLPGPFTFLLPAAHTLPKIFKGRKVVGVRIPDNSIARQLAERLGNPLLSTSIQWEEPEEATEVDSIALRYSDTVDLVVDGGEGSTLQSAIIDLTDSYNPAVVREGPQSLQ